MYMKFRDRRTLLAEDGTTGDAGTGILSGTPVFEQVSRPLF